MTRVVVVEVEGQRLTFDPADVENFHIGRDVVGETPDGKLEFGPMKLVLTFKPGTHPDWIDKEASNG